MNAKEVYGRARLIGLALLAISLLAASLARGPRPTSAAPTLSNVAQGKQVIASGSSAANLPANAVDGNVDTYWEQPIVTHMAHIEVDLAAAYEIAGVDLHLGTAGGYAPSYLRVDYYDGFCWVQAPGALVINNAPDGVLRQFSFAPGLVTTKLRVVIDGKAIGNNVLREIVASGSATTASPIAATGSCAAGAHVAKEAAPYDYLQWLPPEYNQSATRRWPLIIAMHGKGSRVLTQDDHTVIHASPEGFPRQIKNGYLTNFQAILISLDCLPEGVAMTSAGCWFTEAGAIAVLDRLQRELLIDPNRIFFTGLSAGGSTSIAVGRRIPTRLAGIVPVAFSAPSSGHCTLNKLNVWAFGGDLDTNLHPSTWDKYKADMVSLCPPSGGSRLEVTHYPGGGHNTATWDTAYREQALYSFFLNATLTNLDQPAVAHAGANQTITLPLNRATLVGTAIDPDGTIARVSWSKLSGPTVTMTGATSFTLQLTNLVQGTYVFEIRALDAAGATAASDTVQVQVNPSPTTPTPTRTRTATVTGTPPTATPSRTRTRTATVTGTPPTATHTRTSTATPITPSPTRTATVTATASNTPVPPSPTTTRTRTSTHVTLTPTRTATATHTRTSTHTATPVTPSPTRTATATTSRTPVPPSPTSTHVTLTPSHTPTHTRTATPVTPSPTSTRTRTSTHVTLTPSHTRTATPVTPSPTSTRTRTSTHVTLTPSHTPTHTRTATPVPPSPTRTATATPTTTARLTYLPLLAHNP